VKHRGIILIFTGNGKGKTTAAVGCSARMLGWRKRVVYCTFFKNSLSGEIKILKKMDGCKLYMFCCKYPTFSGKNINMKEFEKFFNVEWNNFLKQFRKIKSCDLLVMDEILIAIRDNLIKESDLFSFIKQAQKQMPGMNIILTGRGRAKTIFEIADIITEMRCIKHPYPYIKASKGIEY